MTQPLIYVRFNSMLDWIRMGEKTDILEEGTGDLHPWLGRPNSKLGLWSQTHVAPSLNTPYSLK